jgi:hypothetical protein
MSNGLGANATMIQVDRNDFYIRRFLYLVRTSKKCVEGIFVRKAERSKPITISRKVSPKWIFCAFTNLIGLCDYLVVKQNL